MSNWSPKPLRPEDPNPLFNINDETYVVKAQNAMEVQRSMDGSPHTKLRPSNISPKGESLYIQGEPETVSKAVDPAWDPDAVVKSFLAKGSVPDFAEEDEEKANT